MASKDESLKYFLIVQLAELFWFKSRIEAMPCELGSIVCEHRGSSRIPIRNELANEIPITRLQQRSIDYLELFGFSDASMRMDVGHVDGRVALVAPDPPAYPHAEAFPHVFLNSHRPLG